MFIYVKPLAINITVNRGGTSCISNNKYTRLKLLRRVTVLFTTDSDQYRPSIVIQRLRKSLVEFAYLKSPMDPVR